jgi:uncharacterized membrane protein HdeD (DUF308 family)
MGLIEAYAKLTKTSLLIEALMLIIIGLMFIIDKDFAINLGLIIVGVFMIISGLLPMIQFKVVDPIGVIMVILGALMIAAPFVFASIILIIVGIITIIVGFLMIVSSIGIENTAGKAVGVIVGALIAIAGVLIMTGNDFIFMVYGVLLIIAGAMDLIVAAKV